VRVLVLYNDDAGLLGDASLDTAAVRDVLDAAHGVAAACRKNGWEVTSVAAPRAPGELLCALSASRPDVVFNLVEALGGDARLEAGLAWLLELAGLPYTGSPPLTLSLALHKPLAKAVLRDHGVPVAEGVLFEHGDEPLPTCAPPWIVKPSREDASHGISTESVVRTEAAARARARHVIEVYRQSALVEEFVEGREFNVAVLGEGDAARTLPLAEIDFSRFPAGLPRLVTYAAKWVDGSPEDMGSVPVQPSGLEPTLAACLESTALAAYRALGLRDYGRVDLRLHPERGPFVLEVNANPDITPGEGLARAAGRSGITYDQLIAGIVYAARARANPAEISSRH